MFTGIIEAIGTIRALTPKGGDVRVLVETGKLDLSDVKLGDSIAVNGVCLTAVELPGNGFWADVSRETLTDSVTEGTRALGIPDLRLHDMRREATSRLRDLGFDADARKAVTGHKSDEVHSRYVAVTLESLHDQFDAARGSEPRPQRQRKAGDPQP